MLLFLLSNFIYSQTIITGVVTNENQKPVSLVNVFIKPINSETIIAYGSTNEKGEYILKTNKTGEFNLYFTALSYKNARFSVEIIDINQKIEKNITLIYIPLELNEVIINTEKAITIKKDTIIFDAKSFSKGNENVVEDLLKKIPGLNISNDGTIKVGNQEIEKIMIDGDDFFEKGYKLLTKNMPAHPVDKVELYQHYSDNKHLKGIENSDKVALNLKLKEESKRQWFGNMSLGYGLVSENRYEMRGNLMNFGKKSKYYFLTNLNNIGNDPTGDVNQLIRPSNIEQTSIIGDNQNANDILSVNALIPNLKEKRTNFNNTEMLSLNNIFNLSPKIKLKTIGFFNTDENNFFTNNYQSFSVGNTAFENTLDTQLSKTKIIGFGKINFIYDISKNKTIEFTSKFNSANEKSMNNLIFNGNSIEEKLKSNNQLVDQKIVFTNKFAANKVVILSGRYINEKTPQNYIVNPFLYQDLFADSAITTNNIIQTSENKMQFAGFEAHLLERKKKGSLLEIELGNEFRKDDLQSHFQLKKDITTIEEPADYQNNLYYITNDLYLNTKYLFKLKKIGLITQANFHHLYNKAATLEGSKRQNLFFVNPKFGLEWEINKKNKMVTSYSLNKTNATVLDIYNNYIQTSFRSFSKGTGNFNQLDASSLLLDYTYGSWGDKFFTNTFLLYSKNHDFYSTNTLVEQNYSQSEKIIIKDRQFLNFSSSLEHFFKPISSNLKLTFGGSKSNYKNIVNNSDLREVKNTALDYGFELRSGFSSFFNYHIGSKWNNNRIKTTVENSFTNNMTFLDLSFILTKNLDIQMQTERYHFGNLDKQNDDYYFIDLDAKYALKNDKIVFTLSGQNLLDTKKFREYYITDISISKTEYKLQQRYVLLKMEFRF